MRLLVDLVWRFRWWRTPETLSVIGGRIDLYGANR